MQQDTTTTTDAEPKQPEPQPSDAYAQVKTARREHYFTVDMVKAALKD